MKKAMKAFETDTVATVLSDVDSNEEIEILCGGLPTGERLTVKETIKFGNKVALQDIHTKDTVLKYGASIGTCYRDIAKGEQVHIHNIESNRIKIPQARIEAMMERLGLSK